MPVLLRRVALFFMRTGFPKTVATADAGVAGKMGGCTLLEMAIPKIPVFPVLCTPFRSGFSFFVRKATISVQSKHDLSVNPAIRV